MHEMPDMGIISSIVHELYNFINVDKKITRNAARVHPSLKIIILGLTNVLISQFLSSLDLIVLVIALSSITIGIHGLNRAFFQPFFFLLLFSLMSSGALMLVRIDEFMAVLHDFSIDDLFNNNIVGFLVNFNIRVLTMLWVTRAFLFSTPMVDFLHGLRSIKAPSIIVNLIAMTYRYIFVLAEEFLAVSIAKELRAPAPRSMKERFDELSVIYASTFNRALRRSMTVQTAISLRGTIEQFATRSSRINAAKSIIFVFGATSLIVFLVSMI